MNKSFFLWIAIAVAIVLFIIAVGLLTWFFYINSFNNQVIDTPVIQQFDEFEGLTEQESDRKALDLLAPTVEIRTEQENNQDLDTLGQLQGGSELQASGTSSPESAQNSFFDIQGQYQTPQESINNLEALMPQNAQ